jgi:protein O-mannosyl-transferase
MVTNINGRYAFLIFIVAVLVYLPGLPGGFIYDDYFNFLQNPAINDARLSFADAWSATLSGSSGPLGRPLAMLSFYLNYQLSDLSPLSYKIVNITIHALNSLLVFSIVCRLLTILMNRGVLSSSKCELERLAFWITLLWAVHPINLTAVLYVVQRMTSMAAMFTLLGIYFYLNLRETPTINVGRMVSRLISIVILGVMAALCKENGLLLFLFLFVIECSLYQWRVNTLHEGRCLKVFYVFVLLLPLCFAGFMFLNGDLIASYSGRAFDLTQRLLTESRVLWFYILQILLPQANLFGLHHDDFIISTSIVEPISTFGSIAAFVLLGICAIKCVSKLPWFGFGLAFFFAGHVMESTILPLNLVHEHRNYLPSLGVLIIFVLSLNLMLSRIKIIRTNLVFVLITILFSLVTINRAYDWSDLTLLGERLAQRHPNSITANYEMGFAYSKIYEQTHDPVFAYTAKIALQKAASLSDSDMQPAIALAHVSAMLGEVEDQVLMNKIAMDFMHGSVSVTEVISLRQYVNCQIEALCSSNEIMIRRLFDNLLQNNRVQDRLRDDVLYIYSTYLVTVPDGTAQALTIMQDIVLRNPDTLEYQVKLISIFLTNGKINEANLLMERLTKRYGMEWNIIGN